MVTRDIIKVRLQYGELKSQIYQYGIQEKYVKYKKDNLHLFLRDNLLKGVPSLFLSPNIKSASGAADYIAVDSNGKRIYRETKPASDTCKGQEVIHFPGGTHIFSQLCLESQGFVCNKWKCDYPTFPYAMHQHKNVQEYFIHSGFAEAIEVPVWSLQTEETGFIDILIMWNGKPWILDYKPQASSAKNKHAVAQLLTYKRLLGPLIKKYNIGLAYFDEKDTYVLK